jgi:hypothetical protein
MGGQSSLQRHYPKEEKKTPGKALVFEVGGCASAAAHGGAAAPPPPTSGNDPKKQRRFAETPLRDTGFIQQRRVSTLQGAGPLEHAKRAHQTVGDTL